LLHQVQVDQLCYDSYRQVFAALKFLYTVTLGRAWDVERLPFPKYRQRPLPNVPHADDLTALFSALRSLKYRALLMTCYAAGLRISEACQLRVEDVDSRRMVLRVRQGKGAKERYTVLSPRLLEMLRCYWRVEKPRDYNSAGTFSTMTYIYDATNATNTSRFVYDSITTSNLHIFPFFGAASATSGSGTTPGSSMQMALALAPPLSAGTSTNGAATGVVVSPSSTTTLGSAGLSAVYATDTMAVNTVQPDRVVPPQSDAPAAVAAARTGLNAQLVDAIFAGNPLDPLALVLTN
jgi:hypothetical protein